MDLKEDTDEDEEEDKDALFDQIPNKQNEKIEEEK